MGVTLTPCFTSTASEQPSKGFEYASKGILPSSILSSNNHKITPYPYLINYFVLTLYTIIFLLAFFIILPNEFMVGKPCIDRSTAPSIARGFNIRRNI